MIVDIHTHRADATDAVISVNPWEFMPREGRVYAVGIHPWMLDKASDDDFKQLEMLAMRDDVVMIGECGIDKVRGCVPLSRQIEVTEWHAVFAERMAKPLVLHCVRAGNELCMLRRRLRPAQPWIVHGFRGNERVARMLLDAGCYLSYGEHFNAEAVKSTPADRLLVETDESPLPIAEVCARVAAGIGKTAGEVAEAAADAARHLFLMPDIK